MTAPKRTRRRSRWPLTAAVVLAAGCVSLATPGDRYFEAGDFVPAAAAYEAILEGQEALDAREQRALFRLALTHVIPRSPLHDPARAAELLGRLIDEHPQSAYAVEARLILGLEGDSERLRRQAAQAEAAIEALSAELAGLRADAAANGSRIEELEGTIGDLSRRIERLTAELSRREAELEELKRIDLE